MNAYADSLAPVFWYLFPFIAVALLLALTLKQIPLSDTAGMVARGEAVGGKEAERLAVGRPGTTAGTDGTGRDGDMLKDDDGLVTQHREAPSGT